MRAVSALVFLAAAGFAVAQEPEHHEPEHHESAPEEHHYPAPTEAPAEHYPHPPVDEEGHYEPAPEHSSVAVVYPEEPTTQIEIPYETTSWAVVYPDSTTTLHTTKYTPAPNATTTGDEVIPTAGASRLGLGASVAALFGAGAAVFML